MANDNYLIIVFRMLHNFFLYSITVISFFVGLAITLCIVPFSKNKADTYHSAALIWLRFAMFFSGVKVNVSGKENIPRNQAVIFVSNHQSAADIPILMANIPVPFRFVMKKELRRIPLFGWCMQQAGHLFIERESAFSAYRTLDKVVEALNSGKSLLLFPEGTRSWDGSLGKFKRGSLLAALKSGASIIPVAISGSFCLMPRDTRLIRMGKVKFSIGKPLHIKNQEEYEEKLEEVRNAIARMIEPLP